MKFGIQFCSGENDPYESVHIPASTVGLRLLRKIRKDFGKKYSLDEINPRIGGIFKECFIQISEEKAEELGLFEELHIYEVYVPGKFLNKYVETQYVINEEPINFSLQKEVYFEHVVNEEKILEDWIKDGCPDKWGDDDLGWEEI